MRGSSPGGLSPSAGRRPGGGGRRCGCPGRRLGGIAGAGERQSPKRRERRPGGVLPSHWAVVAVLFTVTESGRSQRQCSQRRAWSPSCRRWQGLPSGAAGSGRRPGSPARDSRRGSPRPRQRSRRRRGSRRHPRKEGHPALIEGPEIRRLGGGPGEDFLRDPAVRAAEPVVSSLEEGAPGAARNSILGEKITIMPVLLPPCAASASGPRDFGWDPGRRAGRPPSPGPRRCASGCRDPAPPGKARDLHAAGAKSGEKAPRRSQGAGGRGVRERWGRRAFSPSSGQ